LIEARDAAIERWPETYPDRNVFEDEALEITSMTGVNIGQQIARVTTLLESKG